MATMIQIYFDGLCEPKNPGGIPVYAFIVSDSDSGTVLGQEAGLAGEPWSKDATHNLAEYTAAITAVKWVRKRVQTKELLIYGDSELVINQLNKVYKVKSQRIRPLFTELIGLLEAISWKAIWIPREKNYDADKLANEFYRNYCVTREGKIMPTMRETGAIY